MSDTILTKPQNRVTGREKVTGAAQYAGDVKPAGTLYGQLVTATVAKGRIVSIDVSDAEAVSGVVRVYTHETLPSYELIESFFSGGLGQSSFWPMREAGIRYGGQVIAYVVAQSLEAAREAAAKVRADYETETPVPTLGDAEGEPTPVDAFTKSVGDADAAMRGAAHTVSGTWETPIQHHNPIEMFWTTVVPAGDGITVHLPSQAVTTTQMALAQQLGMSPGRVQVICPLVGGAFGSKATVAPYVTLTAVVARDLGRPVKLMVSRAQMYTVASFRPETRQEVSLGCDADGRLVAYRHDQIGQTSRFDTIVLPGTEMTTRMYACPNIRVRELTQQTDVNTPGFMRAPNEVPTFFALETAMDELAYAAGIDPVEFRIRNDTRTDPITGVPFSSRSLVECFRDGAERFGWSERSMEPGSMNTDGEMVGWGVATSCYPTLISPASARVRLNGDGSAEVELAAHDVGTGATTVLAMVAAERLGLTVDRVVAKLGNTAYPVAPIAGGSVTTASAGSAVWMACDKVRAALAEAVTEGDTPLKGADPSSLEFAGGEIRGQGGSMALADAVKATPMQRVETTADYAHPALAREKIASVYNGGFAVTGPVNDEHAMFAFGAEFVEVRLNPRTRSIRVPRIAASFAAGRILNAKAGHSQLMGGLVWGVGAALHEATEMDRALGRYVNDNIAEYLIPVNADIGEMEIGMLEERDDYINPLGAKGIGEIGVVGTAAAIATAVFHAPGVRLRKLPIRMEDVLGKGTA
ncbi:MAG: xanthine dehydrogenase family protein molybdopterin-binding subunit [Paracoccaceae bacterium]